MKNSIVSRMTYLLIISLFPVFIWGCADSKSNAPLTNAADEVDTAVVNNTGNSVFESEQVPASNSVRLQEVHLASQIYYVYTNRLNVRSAPTIAEDNILGALGLNDQVTVISEVAGTSFVKIQIIKTNETISNSNEYYVSKDYLSIKRNDNATVNMRNKYFMIQNIATEKMRIYEKMCDDGNCAHKMIFEADMVAGEKTRDGERMTVLGSFNIQKWVKFYEDGARAYPSWYDPNYPSVPAPGSGVMAWTRNLPYSGASVRGAFGWFTALVGPNAHSQWTHGTIGWGADKEKYIKATRGFWANLFTDPRSHGCSRTNNESIAFIRQILNVGAPIIKVYALEGLGDPSLLRYPDKQKTWDYILTKNGVRVDGEKADREEVLARGTPRSQWLEEGEYIVDVHPDIKGFKSGSSGAKSGKNGNVYGLDKSEMRGVYLIDEGLLVNYSHPANLGVGGYGRSSFPGFIISKGKVDYTLTQNTDDTNSNSDNSNSNSSGFADSQNEPGVGWVH